MAYAIGNFLDLIIVVLQKFFMVASRVCYPNGYPYLIPEKMADFWVWVLILVPIPTYPTFLKS